MSNFGNANEAGEGFVNKLYTGVENFRIVAVCPNHDELKKLYSEKSKEDTYILMNDDGKTQAKIVLHLDNEPGEGEPSIKTRITFFVTNNHKDSQTGKKLYINAYGQTAWLADPAVIPENMQWYDLTDSRLAYDGEDNLIGLIRNLLNLPSLAKADNPSDAASQFSTADWGSIFSGNFSVLKSAIMSSPNKIGLLLGVKTTDEGKMYQDIFNRNTLRQWAKASGKFDYLLKNVNEAQDGGGYPKTNFGNQDYVLREYVADEAGASNDSAFKQDNVTDSPFTSETADAFSSGN